MSDIGTQPSGRPAGAPLRENGQRFEFAAAH